MEPQFSKMSVIDAITRFRNKVVELGLPSQERIKWLNEFKKWFEQSLDYDLAETRVFEDMMPLLSRHKSMNRDFKSFWKRYNDKPDIQKFFGFGSEETKLRNFIDEAFKNDERETDIINDLLVNAMEFFKRPLNQEEIDKIRYYVITEKVRLRQRGGNIKD